MKLHFLILYYTEIDHYVNHKPLLLQLNWPTLQKYDLNFHFFLYSSKTRLNRFLILIKKKFKDFMDGFKKFL